MPDLTTIPPGFQRKVLKLDKSPIKQPTIRGPSATNKRIIPTQSKSSFRDKHRELYLPLLIQIYELRGKLDLLKSPDPLYTPTESAETIYNKLKVLENEILEATRWCDGVVLQLSKALTEANKLIVKPQKKLSFWQRIRRFL